MKKYIAHSLTFPSWEGQLISASLALLIFMNERECMASKSNQSEHKNEFLARLNSSIKKLIISWSPKKFPSVFVVGSECAEGSAIEAKVCLKLKSKPLFPLS